MHCKILQTVLNHKLCSSLLLLTAYLYSNSTHNRCRLAHQRVVDKTIRWSNMLILVKRSNHEKLARYKVSIHNYIFTISVIICRIL